MPGPDRIPARQHPTLDRKSVGAVVLGNALEFYDFTVYAFFAKPIGEAFFPANDPTHSLLASLALFGIGYVMRPHRRRADRRLRGPGRAQARDADHHRADGAGHADAGRLPVLRHDRRMGAGDRHRRAPRPGARPRWRGRPVDRLPSGGRAPGPARLRDELADRQPGLRRPVRRHHRDHPGAGRRRPGDGAAGAGG